MILILANFHSSLKLLILTFQFIKLCRKNALTDLHASSLRFYYLLYHLLFSSSIINLFQMTRQTAASVKKISGQLFFSML